VEEGVELLLAWGADDYDEHTIPPKLDMRLRARAEAEGLTVEAYVERLVRADQQAEDELEALALEGLTRR